ncbi:MAG: MATE family efflux transporter [Clostridia bacterium]|nr:MATE family efflux transporter [Clostridia bacterium]MBP3651781.1 MATE family efflux transporter [Clostridia bacterium]
MGWIKKLFAPVDMTEGRPWEKILLFTLPLLLGNIAQQLYNTVDSVVVGKYVGDNALAAVGSAAPIFNLLIVLFVGISMGASIKVSQYFGARDREALSHTIGNCIVLTIISCLVVLVVGLAAARPMLVLLKTPDSILDWCTSYLHILFIGGAGMAFYNILGGVLRGLGDSMSSLLYLAVASILNIILDIVFVASFGMGVAGVALATAISQAISALLCARKLYTMKHLFDMKKKFIRWNREYAMNIIRLGLPSGVTQAIMSMSMIVVQSLTNSFGELFIAANVIVMRVDGFAMLPNFSFGTAMTTFTGQNVGAKQMDMVKKGAKQGTLLALAVSALITGAILFFGRGLMGIFTNTPELVNLSMSMMKILAFGYIAMAVLQSLSGVMRGAGDTMTPMWISIFQTVLLRVPLAYGLCYLTRTPELPNGRRECIFVSLLLAWVIGTIITCIFYLKGKWKKKIQEQMK